MSQTDTARICHDFFLPLTRLPMHAFLLLGDIDGETGFNAAARGDRDQAGGFGQWHAARRLIIQKGCGVDVWKAEALDQCKAMHWEMTTPGSGGHVWPDLMATDDWVPGMTVLVAKYERSSQQARDIARRVAYAQKWAAVFGT